MAIEFPQLKCTLAELEKNTNRQPRILCSLSGCLCKHVGWDHGQHMQTEDIMDCPRVVPDVKTRASYLDYRDGIEKIVPEVEILNAYRDDKGSMKIDRPIIFGEDCEYQDDTNNTVCVHSKNKHKKVYCTERWCPLLKGKKL